MSDDNTNELAGYKPEYGVPVGEDRLKALAIMFGQQPPEYVSGAYCTVDLVTEIPVGTRGITALPNPGK